MKKLIIVLTLVISLLCWGNSVLLQDLPTPIEHQKEEGNSLLNVVRNIFKNLDLVNDNSLPSSEIYNETKYNLVYIMTPVLAGILAIVFIGLICCYCGCIERLSHWRKKWFSFD